MSEKKTGHRAFPPTITHPAKARRFTPEEFAATPKTKLQSAPPVCAGHTGTTIWYAESLGYIVEVGFAAHAPVYIHSVCTFTPTFGMDRIDGEFAQDAEEYVLHEVLGYPSQRLASFPESDDIAIEPYLRSKGFLK